MKKVIISFILITSIIYTSFSQKNVSPNSNDIQIAETLKKSYPDDNVALESSEDYISFGFNKKTNKVTVNHTLTEALINLDTRADIQKYCFYDGESKITEFGVRYKNNRDLSLRITDEAYKNNELFHNDSRVKYVHLDFPLKGYRYLTTIGKEYFDIKYFTKIYFNSEYPTENKTIRIEVPNWLDIELKEINFENFNISKSVTDTKKQDAKVYSYTLENINAFDKEKNAPGPTYIYPHILFLPKSHTKNDEKEVIFNSTQDLYNWYKSLVDALENDRTSLKEKVIELTKDATTDDEKIKNIYYWVQDNIRYIAFEDGIAGFKPDEASNVYNKKYGDCKGMANLTKQMLVEAGFDARLTWIGTKRIAYDYSTPNLSVDNHMICTLFKDGKTIFLDGTEKFNAYGEYADRIQGKQVLIENGKEFILKKVPVNNASFNKQTINYNLVLKGDDLVGTADKTFNGESRSNILYYFNTLKNDKKEEFLSWYLRMGNNNIKVSNIETSDLLDRDVKLDISYDITLKNAVSSFDDIIYVDIDFDKEFAKFDFDKRKTDYIFSYKKALESITILEIPANYKISQLPKNISIKSDNYELSVDFSQQNNTISYKKIFSIKNAKIEKSDFKQWDEFISKLKNVYNEQVIITKQ